MKGENPHRWEAYQELARYNGYVLEDYTYDTRLDTMWCGLKKMSPEEADAEIATRTAMEAVKNALVESVAPYPSARYEVTYGRENLNLTQEMRPINTIKWRKTGDTVSSDKCIESNDLGLELLLNMILQMILIDQKSITRLNMVRDTQLLHQKVLRL